MTDESDLFWLDLDHGVRVRVRPLDTTTLLAARAASQRRLSEVARERQRELAAGRESTTVPDLRDRDFRTALASTILGSEIGKRVIVEWSGMGAVPATADNIGDLIEGNPWVGSAFIEKFGNTARGRQILQQATEVH